MHFFFLLNFNAFFIIYFIIIIKNICNKKKEALNHLYRVENPRRMVGDSKRFVPITKGCPRSNIMGQKNSGSLDTKQKSQQDKDLKDSFIIFKIGRRKSLSVLFGS